MAYLVLNKKYIYFFHDIQKNTKWQTFMLFLSIIYVGMCFYEKINSKDTRDSGKTVDIVLFVTEFIILLFWSLDLLFQLVVDYQEEKFHLYLLKKMKMNDEKSDINDNDEEDHLTAKKCTTKIYILASVFLQNFLLSYKMFALIFFVVEFILSYSKIFGEIERFSRIIRTSKTYSINLISDAFYIPYSYKKSDPSSYELD